MWDRAVAFYRDIFLDHPGVFEACKTRMVQNGPDAGTTKEVAWTVEDRLTWAESVTVVTSTQRIVDIEDHREQVQKGCRRAG